MTGLRFRTFATAAMLALGTAQWASAGPIDLTIGDNDGFGFGAAWVPDGSPLLHDILPDTPADAALSNRRSAAEAAATNGAQQTDIYSAIKDFEFQPLPETFDLVFPFIGELTWAVFSLDMAGFEADLFGQIGVSFNGVVQTNLFDFTDGEFASAVRSFTLGSTALANATLAQQFVVTFTRDLSCDAIVFDYFRFGGNVEPLIPQVPTPEPMTLVMLGTGLTALALRRRHKGQLQSR